MEIESPLGSRSFSVFLLLFFPGALDVQLAQGLEVNIGGAVGHEVAGLVVFREGDDFADAFLSADQHGDAVEAEGEATVWRSTEFEGFKDVAKLQFLLLWRHAEDAEHFGLEVAFVDSDGAAAEFVAIEDHVVGFSANFAVFTCIEQRHVFGLRTSEGVMHGDPTLIFRAIGEQWEIDNPEEVQRGAAFGELLHGGDLKTDLAKDVAGVVPGAGIEEDDIVFLDTEFGDEGFLLVFAKELPQRTLVFEHAFGIALHLDEGELLNLHASLDGELVQADHLARGDASETFGIDGTDDATAFEDSAEDLEAAVREDIGHIDDLQAVTSVGFVRAVNVHGVLIGDALEGGRNVHALTCFEHAGEQAFDELE
jgi:hypothetical protein